MVGGGLALFCAVIAGLGWARGLDERAQGYLMRRAARPWNPKVEMIEIDEGTLTRFGWPVPRELHALLLGALQQAGVKAVAYDIYFTDPDPRQPESDAAFAAVAAAGGLAVMGVEPQGITATESTGLSALLHAGPGEMPFASSARAPVGPLSTAAHLAHFLFAAPASGTYRATYAEARLGPYRLPPLAVRAFGVGRGDPRFHVEAGSLHVAGRSFPLGPRGELTPHLRRSPHGHTRSFQRFIDLLDLETGLLPPEVARDYAGRTVVVGQTAHSLGDHGPLADGIVAPLLTFHAMLLSDLIEGSTLRTLPAWGAVALLLVLALFSVLASALLRPGRAALVVVAVALVLAASIIGLADLWLFPIVTAFFTVGLCAGGTLAARLVVADRQERVIREAFGAYVAPELLRRLMEEPGKLADMKGTRKRLSILFSDIKGYTALSNSLEPEAMVALLKEYLDAMTRIVFRHEGRVDKIMGDGILAYFGDLIPIEDHARQAVRCALAMQEELVVLAARWEAQGRGGLTIRVGIATGEVYVGNIGGAGHIEYTVLGATVNLASRLESNAPPGGVLVARETWEATEREFDFRLAPGLELKGFEGGYDAFVCLGARAGEIAPADRRGGRRLRADLPAQIRCTAGALQGRLHEVSAGGLSLEADEALAEGSEIEVRFELFGARPASGLSVKGVVRHHRQEAGRHLHGIEIDLAEGESRRAITDFVSLFFAANSGGVEGEGGRRYIIDEEGPDDPAVLRRQID